MNDRSLYREAMRAMSYDDAHRLHSAGLITAHEWRAFKLAFDWASPRYSSTLQDSFYERFGPDALQSRRDRARRLWFTFTAKEQT